MVANKEFTEIMAPLSLILMKKVEFLDKSTLSNLNFLFMLHVNLDVFSKTLKFARGSQLFQRLGFVARMDIICSK